MTRRRVSIIYTFPQFSLHDLLITENKTRNRK